MSAPLGSTRYPLDFPSRLEAGQHFVGECFRRLLPGIQSQFGLQRRFVGIINPRKALKFPSPRLFVQPLRISGFADFDRGIDEDLDEIAGGKTPALGRGQRDRG